MSLFRWEEDLTSEILRFAPSLAARASGLALAVELPIQYRVIDVALAPMSARAHQRLRRRNLRPFKELSLSDILVLGHLLEIEVATMDRIAKLLPSISWRTLKANYFDRFEALGLLVVDGQDTYRVGSWASLLPSRMITIEAKLSRWRDALAQAIFNLRIADYSYVALPEDQLSKVTFGLLREARIGLLAIGPNEKSRVVQVAPRSRRRDLGHAMAERIRVLRDIANARGFWTVKRTRI